MDRSLRILMTGSSLSMFGSRISTIAFPLLILHLSGSPLMAGVATFAAIAPSMLVYIPAGALVDRWNPNIVLLASEVGRAAAIGFVVGVLVLIHHPSVYLLIIAMIVEEIFEIFSTLSERRFINWLVGRKGASRAQAYVEVRTHAVVLAGRPFGPFLFDFSPVLPFLVDAFSFAASVTGLLLIRGGRAKARPPALPVARGRLCADITAGLDWLYRDRYAFRTLILTSGASLIAQALLLAFVVAAHAQELSTFAIGVVLAGSGAGGALGSLTAERIPSRIRQLWLRIQMFAWAAALGLLVVTSARSYLWIAFAMSVLGFTGAVGNIELGAYLVRKVADNMLARVTSVGQVITIGAVSLGPMIGGALMRAYGLSGVITWLFAFVLVLAAVSLTVRPPRGSFQDDAAPSPAAGPVPAPVPVPVPHLASTVHLSVVDHSRFVAGTQLAGNQLEGTGMPSV
jgi:MFS family permease